jgi:hypothetical protein
LLTLPKKNSEDQYNTATNWDAERERKEARGMAACEMFHKDTDKEAECG